MLEMRLRILESDPSNLKKHVRSFYNHEEATEKSFRGWCPFVHIVEYSSITDSIATLTLGNKHRSLDIAHCLRMIWMCYCVLC